jgi:hypothetical protein
MDRALDHDGWSRLGEVIWPDDLATAEATRVVERLHAEVLRETGLHARIMARLLRQVERDELGPKEIRLADALLDVRVAGELPAADRAVLDAVRMIHDFRQSSPRRHAEQAVLASMAAVGALPQSIGDRLVDSIAAFMLRADGLPHQEMLVAALQARNSRFLTTYRDRAKALLAKAAPSRVASTIVIWWTVPDNRVRQQLVNETLADAVGGRRSKHLDQIGDLLASMANRLAVNVPEPKGSWRTWWKSWRSVNERRGVLGFLGLRKGGS